MFIELFIPKVPWIRMLLVIMEQSIQEFGFWYFVTYINWYQIQGRSQHE